MNHNEEIIRLRGDLESSVKRADEVIKSSDEIHKTIMDKLEKFGEKLEEVKLSIAGLPDELTKRFDERYASKETEKAVKKVMWIVITFVIGALLSLLVIEKTK